MHCKCDDRYNCVSLNVFYLLFDFSSYISIFIFRTTRTGTEKSTKSHESKWKSHSIMRMLKKTNNLNFTVKMFLELDLKCFPSQMLLTHFLLFFIRLLFCELRTSIYREVGCLNSKSSPLLKMLQNFILFFFFQILFAYSENNGKWQITQIHSNSFVLILFFSL